MSVRSLLIALLVCLCAFGCKKQEDTVVTTIVAPDFQELRYSQTVNANVEVKYVSGDKQDIRLEAEGLPAGVEVYFQPNIKKPPFKTQMSITTRNAPGGTYPVKLIARSGKEVSGSHDITLRIKGIDEIGCAGEMTGEYAGSAPSPGFIDMLHPKVGMGSQKNTIVITNCKPEGLQWSVDCNTNKLTLPAQGYGDAGISGTGKYEGGAIILAIDLAFSNGGHSKYTIVLTRGAPVVGK